MRIKILHYIAKFLNVHFKIDGLPYAATKSVLSHSASQRTCKSKITTPAEDE